MKKYITQNIDSEIYIYTNFCLFRIGCVILVFITVFVSVLNQPIFIFTRTQFHIHPPHLLLVCNFFGFILTHIFDVKCPIPNIPLFNDSLVFKVKIIRNFPDINWGGIFNHNNFAVILGIFGGGHSIDGGKFSHMDNHFFSFRVFFRPNSILCKETKKYITQNMDRRNQSYTTIASFTLPHPPAFTFYVFRTQSCPQP